MPETAISRNNCMPRKKKRAKGLKFGDLQSMIDRLINRGSYGISTFYERSDEITQHKIAIKPYVNKYAEDYHDEEQNDDDSTDEAKEEDDDNADLDLNSKVDSNSAYDIVSVKNRADKGIQASDLVSEEQTTIARLGRASRPHDFKSEFLRAGDFYQDNIDNNQNDKLEAESDDCSWINPYFYDETSMIGK